MIYFFLVDYNQKYAYNSIPGKAKPIARWGRKAADPLKRIAGPPGRAGRFFLVFTAGVNRVVLVSSMEGTCRCLFIGLLSVKIHT
jgi:hypothetical protein